MNFHTKQIGREDINYEIHRERRCAQIRQIIKDSNCIHPEKEVVFHATVEGGYIEFCTTCMKVLDFL